ncbi:MAG TPA: GNAT family N-acetyltransferase [Stellaceae bacterium]|jgi:ribosomal protein S18 acetylase RimI-like enzyme|nr:GNAT family N-acetyltransferase [Stellaceae bacterium]
MGILTGYRGHIDAVEPVLSGWVGEIGRPDVPVAMIVNIDRRHTSPITAAAPRPDVAAAGLAQTNCGFSLRLPQRFCDGAEHEIAFLLPDGRNLHLPGFPERMALGRVHAELVAAAAADVDAVWDLLRRTDAESGLDPRLVRRENAIGFNALRAPSQGFIRYAQIGDRLVGYGRIDRGKGNAVGLGVASLTVLEAYRRKGLGEALMRGVMDAAVQAGNLHEIWLAVESDNGPARHLYNKLGFVRNANRPGGQWADDTQITMIWMPGSRAASSRV